MRLKSIVGVNFMGGTFEHVLHPITLICGRNWTGKSRIVRAIQFALAGYIPGLSQKPNELFERIAESDTVEVLGTFDDGTSMGRRLAKTSKGAVRYSPFGKGLPDDWHVDAVAIDHSAFSTLSEDKRVRYLFDLSKSALPKGSELLRTITANMKQMKLAENTKESEQFIADTIDYVTNEYESSCRMNVEIQDWITALILDVDEKNKVAAANVKRMAQTQQGITQLSQQSVASINENAEAHLQQAQNDLAELYKQSAQLASEMNAAIARRDEAAADSKLVKDELKLVQEREHIVARITELKRLVGDRPDVDGQHERVIEATKATMAMHSEINKTKAAMDDLVKRSVEIEKMTICPLCWTELKKAKRQKMVKRLKSQFEVLQGTFSIQQQQLADAEKKENQSKSDYTDLTKRESNWIVANRELESLTASLSKLNADIASAVEASKKVGSLEEAQKAAERIAGALCQVQQKIDAKREQINNLSDQYKLLIAHRSEMKTRADAETQMKSEKLQLEVYKLMQDMLMALQTELVDKAVAPIVTRANDLCEPLLRSPIRYRNGELGFDRNGKFISKRIGGLPSGAESALLSCAISVSLAADSLVKIAIVDDVLIDDVNKSKLFELLLSLIDRKAIDQAIIVDTQSAVFSAPNFGTINTDCKK